MKIEIKKNDWFTIPNCITLFRILLIPVFIVLLLQNHNIYAFLIFILASISDGVDGFIARHFNQESKLGAILDPIADRGLLICGSVVLCILDRLPLWIVILVLLRDLSFLIFGAFLLKKYKIRIKVIWLGKIATTFFYIGFALLVLAFPWFIGLGIIDVSWLPGFSNDYYFWGIWLVYIGIFLNIFTTSHYVAQAVNKFKEALNDKK